MAFSLYDSDTGGNLLWGPESHDNVPVSDGLFSVKLGSETTDGIPASILGGDVWLEVTVGGETLTPRERLGAVPYALQALTVADGAITTEMIADGAVTQEKAPTLAQVLTASNAKIQYGTVHFGEGSSLWIIFPQSYTTAPRVMITQREAVGGFCYLVTASVTSTSFRVAKMGGVSNKCNVEWLAIGN